MIHRLMAMARRFDEGKFRSVVSGRGSRANCDSQSLPLSSRPGKVNWWTTGYAFSYFPICPRIRITSAVSMPARQVASNAGLIGSGRLGRSWYWHVVRSILHERTSIFSDSIASRLIRLAAAFSNVPCSFNEDYASVKPIEQAERKQPMIFDDSSVRRLLSRRDVLRLIGGSAASLMAGTLVPRW